MPQSHTWQPLSMCMLLTFLASKFLYFQCEARCSEHDQVYMLYKVQMHQRTSIHIHNFDLAHPSACTSYMDGHDAYLSRYIDVYCEACRLCCRRVVGHNEQYIKESSHVAIEANGALPLSLWPKKKSCT